MALLQPSNMTSANSETFREMPPSTISEIRDILSYFLEECEIAYPRDVRLDYSYRDACYADATRRGFDLAVLGKHLDVGIAIGDTAYRHLKNESTRIFVAVFTALLAHIDDTYQTYAKGLGEFMDRFLRREPQRFEALDHLAAMAREFPSHWGVIPSNLITTSVVEFLTSTMIDSATEGMELPSSLAPSFPHFTRRLNGGSQAYCVMSFPPELDLRAWVQVVPDLMDYVNNANDLLSFFKEEFEGENLNFISMSANTNGITKIEALRKLADEVIQGYKRGSQLLQPTPAAWEAFRAFCVGYVGFHSLSVRYKLDQLCL